MNTLGKQNYQVQTAKDIQGKDMAIQESLIMTKVKNAAKIFPFYATAPPPPTHTHI
jgi:hypothetical protein